MNVADRIQSLRKLKGMSQEELADKIGVSRQAVSKWESEQSLPDIDKIILLSECLEVTTDYLLKGIEPKPDASEKRIDARIFAVTGTAINFIGFVVAIFIWLEERRSVSIVIGLILMAMGCMIFAIGRIVGENRKAASKMFGLVNVWFLSLIPISCTFNFIQGIRYGFWWVYKPVPHLGNSIVAYGLCWMVYLAVCVVADIIIVIKKEKV